MSEEIGFLQQSHQPDRFSAQGNSFLSKVGEFFDGPKIATTLLLGAVGLAGCGVNSASQHSESLTPQQRETIIKDLTIHTNEASCATIVLPKDTFNIGRIAYVKYKIGAVEPVNAGSSNPGVRQTSFSPESAIVSSNPQEAFSQIETSICEDPLFGATVANLFANMNVDGIKVVDLNPFLKPYDFNASSVPNNIVSEASKFIPLLNNPNVNPEVAIKANEKYQVFAEELITLLKKFNITGIESLRAEINYHVAASGLVANGLPEIDLSTRIDTKPALILTLLAKNGTCTNILSIGFNTLDQRVEEFPNTCSVPETTTSTTSTPNTVPYTPTTVIHHNTPPTPTTVIHHNTPSTTIPSHSTTTTTIPTTTTFIGPKQNPHQPVGPASPNTTIGETNPGGPVPTTSTTSTTYAPTPESSTTTSTTIMANTTTSTTAAAGGCGNNCP